MSKRIKHTSELPKWFQLEKYDFAKNINSLGWYEQLYARTMIFFTADDYIGSSLPDEFKSAVQAIQDNPNIDISNDERLFEQIPLGPVLYRLKRKNPHQMLPIHSLSLKEYVAESFFMDKDKLAFALDWLNSKERIPDSKLPPWMNESLRGARLDAHNGHSDTLSISLIFPDELLLANFKQYLSHARKKGLVPWLKAYSPNDFKNWAELRALAYADLSLWEKINDITIPCRVMADALFPDGDKGEETVRKTIKPLVKNLLHSDTWNQLGYQAGMEVQEKLFSEKYAEFCQEKISEN